MRESKGLVDGSYDTHLLYMDDEPDPTIEVPDVYPEM